MPSPSEYSWRWKDWTVRVRLETGWGGGPLVQVEVTNTGYATNGSIGNFSVPPEIWEQMRTASFTGQSPEPTVQPTVQPVQTVRVVVETAPTPPVPASAEAVSPREQETKRILAALDRPIGKVS